jgi:DNA-binding NarL/FixJ family response regulator
MFSEAMAHAPYRPEHDAASPELRILLADDHEMVRLAMRHALAPLSSRIEWREASNAADVERLAATDPDLALVDLHMPGSDGVPWIGRLRQRFPALPIIVISAEESPRLVHALIDHGVAGFIPKSDSAAVVLQAVRLVLSGGTYAPLRFLTGGGDGRAAGAAHAPADASHGLTQRQQDVLALLARGLPNKIIARELGLSEGTVKVHLLAIFRALDVRNRTEAVVAAQKKLQATSF